MAEIKVTVSDTQLKSLEYAVYSVQEWCNNAIHNRARVAKDEIISKLIAHCNAEGITIETGEDKQVAQAYSLKIVDKLKTVADEKSKKINEGD